METIFAPATAPGRAGVAIVRISGPRAHDAAEALSGKRPAARRATLCVLKDSSGLHIDTGLVLLFPKNASFTGEAVAELQLHGSKATVSALLSALSEMEGLRLAEPGEFTRRAVENGCMDLTEVEALADLIDAETEAQRKQALRILSGDLAETVNTWRAALIEMMSLVEVTIDFADEEVPVDVRPQVRAGIDALLSSLGFELTGMSAAQGIRDGFEVAIVGPPNIGKSTLLNRLARRDAALVSDVPGTTRDIVEVRMDLDGLLVTFLDTAGLRNSDDIVERMGIERARSRAEDADLRIFLTDGGAPVMAPVSKDDLVLLGKGDERRSAAQAVSGKTGLGVDLLLAHIRTVFANRANDAGSATRERHRIALQSAVAALESARQRLESMQDETDLVAEDLRRAVAALDRLIGRVDVEDVLDEIFSAFCLGK